MGSSVFTFCTFEAIKGEEPWMMVRQDVFWRRFMIAGGGIRRERHKTV